MWLILLGNIIFTIAAETAVAQRVVGQGLFKFFNAEIGEVSFGKVELSVI